MHIDRIEDALEAKRQLLGARSLLREASMPGFKLKVADFKGVSGAAISWSSEWPAHLVLTADEVKTLLTSVTQRLSEKLTDLGVRS